MSEKRAVPNANAITDGAVDSHLRKDFELLWNAAQDELERFWKRAHVILILQTAFLAFIFKDLIKLGQGGGVFALPVFSLLIFIGILGCQISTRGIDVYENLMRELIKKEKGCDGISVMESVTRAVSETPVVNYYVLYMNQMLLFTWLVGVWMMVMIQYSSQ